MVNNETILHEDDLACPVVGHQEVEVCLPVSIKPYAKTGPIKTRCCGNAVVRPCSKNCDGVKNGECCFTITQKLRVDIPIVFGTKTMTGNTYVCCLKPCTDSYENVEIKECDKEKEYDEETVEQDYMLLC